MKQYQQILHRILCLLLCIIVVMLALSVTTLMFTTQPAEATSYSDSGYVNELITGDQSSAGGWNSNVITQTQGVQTKTPEQFVDMFMRFFNTISIIVLGFILVISVARFAGRGIIEMMGTDQTIPALFLTSHERSAGNKNNPKTSSLDDKWVIHMIVETFIFFLIGFGVSAIISIGAGVAIYLVGEVSNVTGL